MIDIIFSGIIWVVILYFAVRMILTLIKENALGDTTLDDWLQENKEK